MIKRRMLAIIVPPIAVCRYGCAGLCAAPIALFWVTGIASLVYGYLGGPLDIAGISWTTVGLGALMWAIAAVWADITVRNIDMDIDDSVPNKSICKIVRKPAVDDSDPFDQIKRVQH